jgi:hypothetical protein
MSINDAKFIKVNNDDSCSIQTKGGMSPQEMSYGGTIIRGGVLHKACIKSYNAKKGGNLKSYNKKKGGNILYNAEFKKYVITDTDLLEEIIEYCQTVDNTEIDLMKKITHKGDPFIQF